MPATDSFENEIINHFMRGVSQSTSSAYLALSTTTPAEDGTNFTEPSTSDGYARQALNLGAPSAGTATNPSTITFGPAVNNSWGTITHLGVFFVSTGGSLKIFKSTTPRSVGLGGSLSFDPTILALTVD